MTYPPLTGRYGVGYKEVLSGGWGDLSSTGEVQQLGSVPPIIVKEKGKWEKEI